MTEEQIFKKHFPEYCAGERCLSPYFDLFQIGFEEGEKQNEELKEKLESSENDKQLTKVDEKLIKAKKIIRNLLYVYLLGKNELAIARIRAEAEQFLKEAEA